MAEHSQDAGIRAPWHSGELALQETVGARERMDDIGRRFVRNAMPDQHRQFFQSLPFVVIGSVNPDGTPFATIAAGEPGFVQSPSDATLALSLRPDPQDPAAPGLGAGDALGILGIEPHTRRRNRANGVVRSAVDGKLTIAVDQSFGNCPKYIQLRKPEFVRDENGAASILAERYDALQPLHRALVEAADTFFVASYVDGDGDAARRQVDVSHRGGKPGFVRVDDKGSLTIPDFTGNQFFNTLGNLFANPRAGLLFVDFRSGATLQIAGSVEIILDGPEVKAFDGAERLWKVRPTQVYYRGAGALPLRFTEIADGLSPSLEATGDWASAQGKLEARRGRWRPLVVTDIVQESDTVRSFVLRSQDQTALAAAKAGQHLPVRLSLDPAQGPAVRTYTLSSSPDDDHYRISVKRQGEFSGHLHQRIRIGDVIEAQDPAGDFVIDQDPERPIVLLAGGIGITPLLSMLRHLSAQMQAGWRPRGVTIFHASRSLTDQAFSAEIEALCRPFPDLYRLIRILSDTAGARQGQDYEASGRITIELLQRYLRFGSYDFYLCGPAGFMQTIYDILLDNGVPDERVHAESFGPAGLRRSRIGDAATPRERLAPAQTTVPVRFARSGKTLDWNPDAGTLLDLAEAAGLEPPYGCRSGYCGTCKTRITQGAVSSSGSEAIELAAGEALICCSVPAASASEGISLDL